MARTQAEIEGIIEAAKGDEVTLTDIDTTSRIGVFNSIKRVVAKAQRQLELLWDAKKRELEELSASRFAYNDKWYSEIAKEFQYGYAMTEIDGQLVYLVEDEEAKIITRSAAKSEANLVKIKVVKESGKLSDEEKVAFNAYINFRKIAGTNTLVISEDADVVKVAGKVWFNAKLDPAEFKARFVAALEEHLEAKIPFNGVLDKNKLRDTGEEVDGCNGFQIDSLQARAHNGSYVAVTRRYEPLSGWYVWDQAALPEDELEFIPE